MKKTILITGATDGVGLATAKELARQGHHLLIHGRNPQKLKSAQKHLTEINHSVTALLCDLSDLGQTKEWIQSLLEDYSSLDVLINNAGVFKTPVTHTADGLDVRFVVNALSPYMLTRALLPIMRISSRVINLSSAAQTTVNIAALKGNKHLNDSVAYAQSKLALTMWSHLLGMQLKDNGPTIVAVNPASFLGSKMVQEAYGITGNSLQIGADIVAKAALSETFAHAHGRYFDNDAGSFANPHPDAMDLKKCQQLVSELDSLI